MVNPCPSLNAKMDTPLGWALLVVLGLQSLLLGQTGNPAGDPVDVEIVQFGAGNVFRPGELAGIEVKLTSELAEDETLWVQWDHETAEGDLVAIGRPITLSPGQPRSTWLYVPLSPHMSLESECQILVRRYANGVPGETLTRLIFTPTASRPRQISPETGLLGIVGGQAVGLDAYERPLEFMPNYFVAAETSAVRLLNESAAIPDRWVGLQPYEAMIWTDAPVDLSLAQEQAILEWMRRGGHLVIMLPQAGNPWELGRGDEGPLGSILPGTEPESKSVLTADLLPRLIKQTIPEPVVTSDSTGRLNSPTPASEFPRSNTASSAAGEPLTPTATKSTLPVQVLRSETLDTIPAEDGWVSVWDLEGTGTVAAKRPVGHGQLTLLGVDLDAPRLRARALARTPSGDVLAERVPETDVFWNGLLGRRSDSPTKSAANALIEDGRLVTRSPSTRLISDSLIVDELADSLQVGGSLLITAVLFLVYWLVAIPIGWTILKHYRRLHWTWLVFLGTTILFSGLAWLTASIARQSKIGVRHLTILDHVHGENLQRGISWMSIFTPGYGDYLVSLDGAEDNILSTWEPTQGGVSKFPDAREAIVDLDSSSARISIPSRATTSFLKADWRGPIASSDWGGLLRMDPSRPIRILRNAQGEAVQLQGALLSNLPGPLIDTQIILVDQTWPGARQLDGGEDQRRPWIRPSQSGRMERRGWAWALPRKVEPGEQIDLSSLSFTDSSFDLETSFKSRYSDSVKADIGTPMRPLNEQERRRSLEALSFCHQLEPPSWIREANTNKDAKWSLTRRTMGRDLDRSGWMTRPALIVTGFLVNSEIPLPVQVGSAPPEVSTGLVMVRWIYPIPEPITPGTPGTG